VVLHLPGFQLYRREVRTGGLRWWVCGYNEQELKLGKVQERGAGLLKLLALVVVAFFSACSAQDRSAESSAGGEPSGFNTEALPPGASEPSLHPINQEWRRLSTWAGSVEFSQLTYDLWQLGMSKCMKELGFAYVPQPFFEDSLADIWLNPLNRAVQDVYGYHLPTQPAEVNAEAIESDDEYAAALENENGCGVRALRYAREFPEAEAYFASLRVMIDRVEEAIFAVNYSPENLALQSSWSDCMQGRGYSFADPGEPSTIYSEAPTITDVELATRRAHRECDEEIRWTEQLSATQTNQRVAVEELNAAAIDELDGQLEVVIRLLRERTEQLVAKGAQVLG
jgi:hypothetical protein